MSLSAKIQVLERENAQLKLEILQKSIRIEKDEKWSQSIIDSLPNPLFIKDDKHLWVACNNAFCDLINLSREEMFGKSDYDFFDKKQADVFWEKDSEVLITANINWNEEELTINGKTNKLLTSYIKCNSGSCSIHIYKFSRNYVFSKVQNDNIIIPHTIYMLL